MVRLLLNFFAILAVAAAFSPRSPPMRVSVSSSKPLFMFNAEDGKASAEKSKGLSEGLSEVKPGESADALEEVAASAFEASSGETQKVQVLNRNTGELMEVDMNESFLANENLEMNWWAWLGFVAVPAVLLGNDAVQFFTANNN